MTELVVQPVIGTERERQARELGRFTHTAFCAVE